MHECYSIQVSDGLPTGVTSFCTFSTTLHGHVSTVQTKPALEIAGHMFKKLWHPL